MPREIKVCFVSILAYPLFNSACNINHGGAEVELYNFARELVKDRKYKLRFIVADAGQEDTEYYDNIKVIKSFPLRRPILNITGPMKLYAALNKANPDIIISESAGFETGMLCLYSKFHNKKFIYRTAHVDDCNRVRIRKKWWGFSFGYALKNADQILAQTKDQQKLLMENHGINSILLKNGYTLNNVDAKEKKSILWVGRGISWKRPEIFLKLAKHFPNEKFIMIMSKNNKEMKIWNTIKYKSDKIKNLTFIEKVPFSEIDYYFRDAKVFVNSSKYEGFPVTFLHAAMNRTPILSLNVNPDNFITKHGCGLYSNDEYDCLVRNLKKLIDDRIFYTECSNQSFAYAFEHHNLVQKIQEFKEVIFRLVD
tara:strand:+ start:1193 stop:2296 length:1104 start_codon:yes stop_codon:yes gene_type:complete